MSNSKEVASLKKELEALQKEIEGSKTPASQASIPLSSEDPSEGLSLGPSAVESPVFGPGGTGASGALANAAIPASDSQVKENTAAAGTTPETVKQTPSSTASESISSESMSLKRDESVPSLRLDDLDADEESQQGGNGSNDAMSDSSAVVVDAEDGQPSDGGR